MSNVPQNLREHNDSLEQRPLITRVIHLCLRTKPHSSVPMPRDV